MLWTLRGHVFFFELWYSVDICPGVRLLELIAALLLVFQWTSILFSTGEAPTCSLKVTAWAKLPHTQLNTVLLLSYSFFSLYLMFLKDMCLLLLILSTVLLSFHFSHYFIAFLLLSVGSLRAVFFFPFNFWSYTLTPFIPSVSCFPINIVRGF